MTLSPSDGPTKISLPVNHSHSLWLTHSTANSLGLEGTFQFRGHRIRINVPNPNEVLFPTDCGMSVLDALHRTTTIDVTGKRFLDIGTGSGIYTVALLKAGCANGTALDINTKCLPVIRGNLVNNNIELARANIVIADLNTYTTVRPYDLIIANLPHLPHVVEQSEGDGLAAALVGGVDGRAIYDVLLRRLDALLSPGGTLIVGHSSLTDIPRTRRELSQRGFTTDLLATYEIDIPLPGYAHHSARILPRLEQLRAEGKASFKDGRMTVEIMIVTRPAREYSVRNTTPSSR